MAAREDYTVELEQVFRGPLDLLLHLVKEQEVEIHEVELHRVVDGYFRYLARLEHLDIEVAGDFLVLAATLMAIKSRSLLPREEVELEDDLDPQDELIQRLIEYRRFKGASEDLELRWVRRAHSHPRGWRGELAEREPERSLDLGDLSTWDLLAAYSRLMRETLAHRPHRVQGERRPLRWYVQSFGRAIRDRGRLSLSELLYLIDTRPSREDMIGSFCALLELVKLGVVGAEQSNQRAEIWVRLREGVAAEELDALIGSSTFMDEEEPRSEREGAEDAAWTAADPQAAADEDDPPHSHEGTDSALDPMLEEGIPAGELAPATGAPVEGEDGDPRRSTEQAYHDPDRRDPGARHPPESPP